MPFAIFFDERYVACHVRSLNRTITRFSDLQIRFVNDAFHAVYTSDTTRT